jgi:hypothetical protein
LNDDNSTTRVIEIQAHGAAVTKIKKFDKRNIVVTCGRDSLIKVWSIKKTANSVSLEEESFF